MSPPAQEIADAPLPSFFDALSDSPWTWGTIATLNFYFLIPHLTVAREFCVRYFCSHPIEYGQSWLFFVGVSAIVRRLLWLRKERAALVGLTLAEIPEQPLAEPLQMTAAISERCRGIDPEWRSTHWVSRIRDLCEYVVSRKSTAQMTDHLKYLATGAVDRMHDQYALLQTIIWAVPIGGFLGTVVGITVAIGNIAPDRLESSLNDVTGGLAVAFDTTAVALTQSLGLVFLYLFVKRHEEGILATVERRAQMDFGRLLALPGTAHPLIQAEAEAARDLLERTGVLIQSQTSVWQESIEQIRMRWRETLEQQQQRLVATLEQGIKTTFEDHAGQLTSVREEFLAGYRAVSQQLSVTLSDAEDRRKAQDQALQGQWEAFSQRMQADLDVARTAQVEQAGVLLDGVLSRIESWQDDLRRSTQASECQLAELMRQGDVLTKIMQGEEQLTQLQNRLSDNLQAVRNVESFDETLHSLNAAVHVLTGRVRRAA